MEELFLIVSIAGLFYGLGGAMPALADVNWKKYAGTKIGVNLVKGPRGENLQKYEKEFTDLTGIQVSSEQTPEQQQRQKAVIELSSGRPSFDVVHNNSLHHLPVAMARLGNSFELVLPMRPGPHKLLLRVNGGEWLAPPNLPTVEDEFGGRVAMVVVP